MSRDKFEEWAKTKCEPWELYSFGIENTKWFVREQVYAAWLAGRESMRDEAANFCNATAMAHRLGENKQEDVMASSADTLAMAIRKIEP